MRRVNRVVWGPSDKMHNPRTRSFFCTQMELDTRLMTRQETYAVSPHAVLVSDLVSALFEGLPLLDDIIPTIFLIITIQIGDPLS